MESSSTSHGMDVFPNGYLRTVRCVLQTHSSRKLFQIGQQMAFDFIFVSHGCMDKSKLFRPYAYLAVS